MSNKIEMPTFSPAELKAYAFLHLHACWNGRGKILLSFSAVQLEITSDQFYAAVARLNELKIINAQLEDNIITYEIPVIVAEKEAELRKIKKNDPFSF